jgi:hypothetical protein
MHPPRKHIRSSRLYPEPDGEKQNGGQAAVSKKKIATMTCSI